MEGFDETFVSEIPSYLKCIVCHLVLRRPVQIMRCGHRFCQPCFNRIKDHCKTHKSQLLCPVDRVPIDLSKVFEDTGIDRVIGDLVVRCPDSIDGCQWAGELRNLWNHQEVCEYMTRCTPPAREDAQEEKDLPQLKELRQRMIRWEHSLLEKEEDIALLKQNLEEMKKIYGGRLKEVDDLKKENRLILSELDRMREKNRELVLLNSRIEAMERRMTSSTGDELNLSESRLAINLVIEADDDGKASTMAESVYDDLPPAYRCHAGSSSEYTQSSCGDNAIPNECIHGEETEYIPNGNRSFYGRTRCSRDPNTRSLDPNDEFYQVNELYSACSINETGNQNRISEYDRLNHSNTNNRNLEQNLMNDSVRKIIDLKDHITNIENILFCETPVSKSKEILFQWILQNYTEHFEKGDPVYSPIFFTEIKGYCFRLKIGWTGDEKEHLAIGLHLCRGRFSKKELEPFDLQYSIEMCDKDGNTFSEKIPLADVEEYRVESFSIFPGENCAQRACGNAKFLSKPKLDNYIVNDMLFVKCRVILQNKVSPLKRPGRLFKNRYF